MSDTNLDTYFTDIIQDNKGNPVTDLNKGLRELFIPINDANIKEVQRYLVSEIEDGYSDLLAKHSILGSEAYWWWVLLLNGLTDPLADIKSNWIYSINSIDQIDELNGDIKNTKSNIEKSRIGETVDLN